MSESARAAFVRNQVFSMTLMATVQRAHVYRDGCGEDLRSGFQRGLRQKLEEIAATYTGPVSDSVHEGNIVSLAESLSASHGVALRDGRFRIGSAQKALNLFLKYRWCLGEGPEPPHCPFDFRIIAKLPREAQCSWTTLDSIDGYHKLVAGARASAAGRSLANWELTEYNRA